MEVDPAKEQGVLEALDAQCEDKSDIGATMIDRAINDPMVIEAARSIVSEDAKEPDFTLMDLAIELDDKYGLDPFDMSVVMEIATERVFREANGTK